jgi:hypothetical protein
MGTMMTEQEQEYGEAEALALLEQRLRRRGEIRESIHRLDGELEEVNRGAAVFLADGEEGEGVPEALGVRRHAIREELQDLHSGLGHLDTLINEAEEDLREIRQEGALAEYVEARGREKKAAGKVERATKALCRDLSGFREASRIAYSLGLAAGAETSLHYRRRLQVSEHFLRTHLGEYSELLRTPVRFQVPELAARLDAVLPVAERDKGEVKDGNAEEKATAVCG